MSIGVILGISVLLQVATAILAIRLIRITGRRWAWILISAAIALMAVRRGITLFHLVTGDLDPAPDPAAEAVALAISVLMLAGVAAIAPVFGAGREAERRYRHLFDDAPLMYVITRDEAGTPVIDDCNRAFFEKLGYSRDEVVGRPLVDFYSPGSRTSLEEGGYQRALEGKFGEEERALVARDGSRIDTLLQVVPETDHRGEAVGTRAMYIDVTERTRLQRQLFQAQKMEAVGQLAGGIAHDFNNLLTAITGYSGFLLGREDLDEATRSDVAKIHEASDRAAELTRQLLAFGRRQPLEMKVLDLNEVVGRLDSVLQRVIREDIEVVVEPGAEIGNVRADPGQLEQVLMNLAINASDAMPGGGCLTIETSSVEIPEPYVTKYETARPGRHVLLTVSDTGAGMDRETAARAFEPFFTTKAEGKGTGLGLSTVYGVVKQHGGMIFLDSEPGEGTSFRIYLPRVEEPVESFQRAAAEGVPGVPRHSGTILLVEDEDVVRDVAIRILRGLGYRVLPLADPFRAIELVTKHDVSVRDDTGRVGTIDLLLTDIVMPGMDGATLARRLRAERPDLKVLFMSGYAEEASADPTAGHRLPPGATFMAKPFTPEELGAKVREALGHAGS